MGYGIKDVPWYEVYLHKTDERRDKTRCIHFYHLKKKDGFCRLYNRKCCGSAHCDEYKERTQTPFKN